MTDAPALGTGSRLTFNSPLGSERADRLVADLAARVPSTVIDYGCGWGELLLRVVAAAPQAWGVGVDTDATDIARARTRASTRALADRVTFVEAPATAQSGGADIAISIGAYQAFGSIADSLAALRTRVNPGGRLLFGAEYWERPPTAEQLGNMWPGITADDCTDLVGIVDQATAAGFRPLRIETATRGEWEEFESGFGAEVEEWLLDNPSHPETDAIRAKVDTSRSIWLRGHRDVMGFAYLTLGVPVSQPGQP
jgi:SAM-dependent methyltransferase